MSTSIRSYLTNESRQNIAQAIQDIDGNEVFLLGTVDVEGRVENVRVVARGTEDAVPAIISQARPGEVAIHNHPSGIVHPSDNDVEIASYLGNNAVGFYIVNNEVTEIYVVVEPVQRAALKPLDAAELDAYLLPDGIVAKKLSKYEFRQGQLDMMHEVVHSFNNNTITALEAGTGTGKTLAYLLPAIHWALQNDERCVISTNTINLQEQLIHKDIPFLQSILRQPFESVLVKGRSNYLCLRKAHAEERELPSLIEDEDLSVLRRILQWSKTTNDGSLSDLDFLPQTPVWERVNCETDTCTGIRCSWYDTCFLFKARREASLAHLIIVNHHLLFADLALRNEINSYNDLAVLPPYHRLIIDEAHHIENVATGFFGTQISKMGVTRLLNRIYAEEERLGAKGTLSILRTRMTARARGTKQTVLTALSQRIDEELIPLKIQSLDGLIQVCECIEMCVRELNRGIQDDQKVRLTEQVRRSPVYRDRLLPAVEEAVRGLHRFESALQKYAEDMNTLPKTMEEDVTDPLIDLNAMRGRLQGLIDSLHDIFQKPGEGTVTWLELRHYQRGTGIAAVSVPLNVADLLRSALFQPFHSVLMTSATLTVDRSFDFFNQRLGLTDDGTVNYISKSIRSPFNYDKQVIIGVPLNLSDPSDKKFQQDIIPAIRESIKTSAGKTLVLFTSYAVMNAVYAQLEDFLFDMHYTPLKQGNDINARLLDRFRKDINSVLFATSSFWEGIDVEGEALESVIIVKLPFVVPTDPLHAARSEDLERQGENSFYAYSVPLAALRLKQGFGRLIRRKTDKGCIVILDNRILKKAYGKILLNTLPDSQIISGNQGTVFQSLKSFLAP